MGRVEGWRGRELYTKVGHRKRRGRCLHGGVGQTSCTKVRPAGQLLSSHHHPFPASVRCSMSPQLPPPHRCQSNGPVGDAATGIFNYNLVHRQYARACIARRVYMCTWWRGRGVCLTASSLRHAGACTRAHGEESLSTLSEHTNKFLITESLQLMANSMINTACPELLEGIFNLILSDKHSVQSI